MAHGSALGADAGHLAVPRVSGGRWWAAGHSCSLQQELLGLLRGSGGKTDEEEARKHSREEQEHLVSAVGLAAEKVWGELTPRVA